MCDIEQIAALIKQANNMHLELVVARQVLLLYQLGHVIQRYFVSSAKNGIGEIKHSLCTPRGWHIIRAKIGQDVPSNAVFVRRRLTGELFVPAMRAQFPERDWILTRILWLSGLEIGKNRLHERDTMRRYIYIHGSPDDVVMGVPGSKGCIRMHNHDIIDLFSRVLVRTPILIHA